MKFFKSFQSCRRSQTTILLRKLSTFLKMQGTLNSEAKRHKFEITNQNDAVASAAPVDDYIKMNGYTPFSALCIKNSLAYTHMNVHIPSEDTYPLSN